MEYMEIETEDASTPVNQSPRDIFSPQHRLPRAPTPPTHRLAELLDLLTEEERELILSLNQDTRSNVSRDEEDSPSIDSVMGDQLSSLEPTGPATPQPALNSENPSGFLADDIPEEAPRLDTAVELGRGLSTWAAPRTILTWSASGTPVEGSGSATPANEIPMEQERTTPPRPIDYLRFPRPTAFHIGTDDYDDSDFYEEPAIDIETDNPDFARLCRRLYHYYPFDPSNFRLTSLAAQARNLQRPDVVTREDMETNELDYQGIPWQSLGISRDEFRVLRNQSYKNYRNIQQFTHVEPDPIPVNRRFFRFNRQDNTKRTRVGHFQLRNLLSVTSRNDIFYSSEHCKIRRTGVDSRRSEVIIDLSATTRGDSAAGSATPVKITSMTARHGICIAGGFTGEYAMKSLYAPFESQPITGVVTLNENGITNHVHAHLGRSSGSPTAVFCNNDSRIRVLDCYSNTFISEQDFDWPINCAATSPDGRLRVIVGDDKDVMIVDADSGSILRTLEGHQDFGFSCAWSDDGYTIATGNQDKTVRIYDARNFSRSITQIGTTLAGVRTLGFSRNGTGRRVLVCPEPADYVNVVDAVTWDGMQRFSFFGEIGGVEFSPVGGEMFVANADISVGGLMEFERCREEKWDLWEGEDGLRTVNTDSQETEFQDEYGDYDEEDPEDDEEEDEDEGYLTRRSPSSSVSSRSRRKRITSSLTRHQRQPHRWKSRTPASASSPSTRSSQFARLLASASEPYNHTTTHALRSSLRDSTYPHQYIPSSVSITLGSSSPSSLLYNGNLTSVFPATLLPSPQSPSSHITRRWGIQLPLTYRMYRFGPLGGYPGVAEEGEGEGEIGGIGSGGSQADMFVGRLELDGDPSDSDVDADDTCELDLPKSDDDGNESGDDGEVEDEEDAQERARTERAEEEAFVRWKKDRIREAIRRDEERWEYSFGGRRRRRGGVELGEVFV